MLGAQPHRCLEDSPGSAPSHPPPPTWVTQGDWQGRRRDPPAGLVVVHSVCVCVCRRGGGRAYLSGGESELE